MDNEIVENLENQITAYGSMIILREALIGGRYVIAAEDFEVIIVPEIYNEVEING